MRIVQVISGYFPQETAGAQVHVRDLSHGLGKRGHEVEIFTRVAGDDHAEFEVSRSQWEGIPVNRITNNFADLDRFELLYTHPTIDSSFDNFLNAYEPDLVHVHHLTCLSTSMIQVARRRGIPVVMTFHDYWMVCPRGQRIRPEDLGICETLDRTRCLTCLNRLWPHLLPQNGARSMLDRLLRRPPAMQKLAAWESHVRRMLDMCQAFTAPARFHRARFVEWGIPSERLFLAPYGFLKSDLLGKPRGRRPVQNIGFIGAVIPSKGVHVLCEAFNQLNRQDLALHIHGEATNFHGDTTYLDRLRAIAKPSLDVRFHGRYEHRDLSQILAGLDLLVAPALWWENSPLVVREGMLAGVPVIASKLGGLQEAVEEGVAIGFEGGNSRDLARVLSQVLSDADLREEMSHKADLVCDIETNVGRMEEIYQYATRRARGENAKTPAVFPVALTA